MLNVVNALGLPEDAPIDAKILSNTIESAQKRIEDQNFKRRKYVLSYDDVMNQQRNIIYSQRNSVLNGDDISGTITKMIESTIIENVSSYLNGDDHTLWDFVGLREAYKGLLTFPEDFEYSEKELKKVKPDDIANLLYDRAIDIYKGKEELFGAEQFREIERAILLQNVDYNWMEHIDAMDDLKGSVGLNAYAQRNPVVEYKIQGGNMFEEMVSEIRAGTVRMILTARPRNASTERKQVLNGNASLKSDDKKVKPTPVKKVEKAGPNDPCPCGSGKKYKKCCLLNEKEQ
jgi:preprotein translocase subunit SecA